MTTKTIRSELKHYDWKIRGTIKRNDLGSILKMNKRIAKLQEIKAKASSQIKLARSLCATQECIKAIIGTYIDKIKAFIVTSKESIVDFLYLYKEIMDIFGNYDQFEELKYNLSQVQESIANYRSDPVVIDLEETKKRWKEKDRPKYRASNWDNLERLFWLEPNDYVKLITPETNKKAIDMGFSNIEEPLRILNKIETLNDRFKSGYGVLVLEESHVGFGFKGLMDIIEGPVFTDVFDLFNIKYEFVRRRRHIIKVGDFVFDENSSGLGASGRMNYTHEYTITDY